MAAAGEEPQGRMLDDGFRAGHRGDRQEPMVDGRAARVVVLGAGFAGLRAVRRLARAGVRVLWVDGRNYHCFLPLLYQVAIAGLEPQEIAYPARSILRRLPSAEFRLARVVAGDPAARTLVTAAGERIGYDRLIIAAGEIGRA